MSAPDKCPKCASTDRERLGRACEAAMFFDRWHRDPTETSEDGSTRWFGVEFRATEEGEEEPWQLNQIANMDPPRTERFMYPAIFAGRRAAERFAASEPSEPSEYTETRVVEYALVPVAPPPPPATRGEGGGGA